MNEQTSPDPVTLKTRELCQTIVSQPTFQSVKSRVEAFMGNDGVKELYQKVSEQGEYLQHKQDQGVELTEDEISAFEKERDSLLSNEVAKGFLSAQDDMRQIQESVNSFLSKTFELGRVPSDEEVAESQGSCGSGCGCH